MKQIHIRRFLSLLLAALTLWAAAVTAGSDSAAAALQQLRQGSRLPQQALRWELGDFFGLDSLSAVTVMTLAQSPLLLAGRSTVAALLSAGVTRDPPEPVAPESPDTPSPSADSPLTDGLTFADNGVPAQTTAPTSSKGYTVVNGVYLKNSSGTELDADALSDGSFAAQLTDDGPQVLIYHTHATEAYTQADGNTYKPSGDARTTDTNQNVVRVGAELCKVLEARGIQTVHLTDLCDYPAYNGSYGRSLELVQAALKKYPTVQMTIDVHRDAILADDGTKYKVSTEQDGKTVAQLMLVMGTNASGLDFDDWKTHLNYAVTLQSALNAEHPGLMRPINLRKQRFNLHLTPGSMLLEVGSSGNTLREAIAAVQLFGNTLATELGAP